MLPLTTRVNADRSRDFRRDYWIQGIPREEIMAYVSAIAPIDAPERIASGGWVQCFNERVGDYSAMGCIRRDATPAEERMGQIQDELRSLGYRMEASLSALDEEGHTIVSIASGELAEDEDLPPSVTQLATEWTHLAKHIET